MKSLLLSCLMLCLWMPSAFSQSKLRDLTKIQHAHDRELIGYGLVTGLDRTGDRTIRQQGAAFTVQSIVNMLQNFGINVDPTFLRTRNVAAVMVTARVSPYHAKGSYVDVTVSSLGDATSLAGGVLLQTPLIDPEDQDYYVRAQGSLIVGGRTAEVQGARISQNQTLTGVVPNGGIVIDNSPFSFDINKPLGLILVKPSFINAERMARSINDAYDAPLAAVFNAGLLQVNWPDDVVDLGDLNRFVSELMDLEIDVDVPARVVINERTGTIVAGGAVKIGEVLVSHGNIQITTQSVPFVSQPQPFSTGGQTIAGDVGVATISEDRTRTFVLEPNISVTQLAAALNTLGLSPRDIISIFQAINRAGALKAELVIM